MTSFLKSLTFLMLTAMVFLSVTLLGIRLILFKPVFLSLNHAPVAYLVANQVFSAKSLNLSLFTPAEASHLQDVQRVYLTLSTSFLILIAFNLAVLLNQSFKPDLNILLKKTARILLILLTTIGVIGLEFWDQFFTFFHLVFFPKGNWSFPADSLLINLFPVNFWQATAALLLSIHFIIYLLILTWPKRGSS